MVTVKLILEYLKTLAPVDYKEQWDNVGLLCGHSDREVHRALIALDPFLDTAQEACRLGAELVICHHPLLFSSRCRMKRPWAGRCCISLSMGLPRSLCTPTLT